MFKDFLIIVLVVCVIGINVGCEELSGSSSSRKKGTTIKQTAIVVRDVPPSSGYVAGYKLDNGNVIMLDNNSFVTRIRISCSGYNLITPTGIVNGDEVTIKYLKETGADFANRIFTPFEVEATRAECLNVNNGPQFVVDFDTDSDKIGDTVDNCITIPNQSQTDTDNDGVGDACDADPTDPTIQ